MKKFLQIIAALVFCLAINTGAHAQNVTETFDSYWSTDQVVSKPHTYGPFIYDTDGDMEQLLSPNALSLSVGNPGSYFSIKATTGNAFQLINLGLDRDQGLPGNVNAIVTGYRSGSAVTSGIPIAIKANESTFDFSSQSGFNNVDEVRITGTSISFFLEDFTYNLSTITTINSIARANTSPNNTAAVNYTATFGAGITGLTASNFSLTTSGVSGASIGTPATADDGTTWTVPVNTGSGTGTIILNLANASGLSMAISTSLPFSGDTYNIDKSPPSFVSGAGSTFLSNNGNPGRAKVGDKITLSMHFNEDIQTPTMTIAGHAVAVSNVGDNSHWTGSYTMTSGDAEGAVAFTMDFSDIAGNAGTQLTNTNTGATIIFDRSAPALPSTPVLASGSDSGTPNDNITNITTPIFTGTAENNSRVRLYDTDGTTVLGTATASNVDGTWSITSTTLGQGNHTITAIATDLTGNASGASLGLTVTINTMLPSAILSPVSPVEETSNTFTITYNDVSGNPDLYSVTVAATNQMPGFNPVSNFSLHPNTITVDIPNTAAGTYDFILTLRVQAPGNSSAGIPFSVTVNAPPPPPTVTLTGTLNAFSSCLGSISAEQSFKVAGTNLTGDITVTAPAGFEISKTTGTGFTTQLTFTQSSGVVGEQNVFVRIAASATGTPSGNIAVTSSGTTEQDESASGTVNDIPTITVGTVSGVSQSATTFNLPYSGVPSGTYIYYISRGARRMSDFNDVNGFALVPNISVNLPVSLTPGVYDFNLYIVNTATGCSSAVQPFTLVVYSNDATLSSLTTTAGTISPAFAPATLTGYTAGVPNTTTSVTVTPTTTDANTSDLEVRVNGGAPVFVFSGNQSAALALNEGANTIDIQVLAQDGTTTKTYTLTVTRQPSAQLFSLVFNPGITLHAVTGPAYKNYTGMVDNSISSVTVIPKVKSVTATITVNNVTVASGTASGAIHLDEGENTITTIVTDGATSHTYSFVITRLPIASLLSISVSPNTALKVVSGSNYKDYTANVVNSVSSVTVTPVAPEMVSVIKVNGVQVTSGTASGSINLDEGENVITTVVTNGAFSHTYSITITRRPPAQLFSLLFNPGITVHAVAGADYRNYAGTVDNSLTSVTATPKALDPAAIITINNIAVTSGTASGAITLNEGDNTITAVVTQGSTNHTYTFVITRTPSLMMSYDPSKDAPITSSDIVVHQNVSPNGDGRSDGLVIEGIAAHPDNKLQIMSRSGALVYEAKGYDNATKVFDGHANSGKLQQAGTYFYSLEYKDGKETRRKTGFIVLKY